MAEHYENMVILAMTKGSGTNMRVRTYVPATGDDGRGLVVFRGSGVEGVEG